MKNKIFLALCLILVIISIASVSASQNINQTLDITDNGNSDIIGIPVSNIDANDTVSLACDENNIVISNDESAGNVWYVNGTQTGSNDILNSNYMDDSAMDSLKNNGIYGAGLNNFAKQDLNVNIVADPITIGQDAIVKISGWADATGEITITVYGRDYPFPITGGNMTIGIPDLYENTTVVFTYSGDENYNNFTKSVDIIVNRVDSNISVIVSEGYEGDPYYANVLLPGAA
uniref:hypothetical protein n=1 Tax=Methanobrevibacter sp. TaxID=66852 RepID=UPI003890C363